MICPKCQKGETQVIDSRDDEEGRVIRRRRECLSCSNRFTTFEKIEPVEIIIIKRDGSRENFSREKVLSGIKKACRKRPITEIEMEKMVDKIEAEILSRGKKEIKSEAIGKKVLKLLQRKDEVAYLRFLSVYSTFENLSDFKKALRILNRSQ